MEQTAEKKEWQWYFDELMSEQCLCEGTKKRGHSFCYRCFKALPPEMQNALYKKMAQGYEEAFEDAVKWLETEVW